VELYSSGGGYLGSTTTDVAGAYTLAGLLAYTTYTVRVAGTTVQSTRTGSTSNLVGIQTYRTNGTSGTAVAVLDHVGGEDPSKTEAGVYPGAGTLASTGAIQGLFTTGLNKLWGDDLHMNATGLLGTCGFSIANTSTADTALGKITGDIQFFRKSDLTFIDGFNWNIDFGAAGLAPQSSSRVSFADGALESIGIILDTPDVYMTGEFTSATVVAGSEDPEAIIGIQIRNPAGGAAAPGASSADALVINGTPTNSPFGGNPVANTSLFVRVSPVPEPACLSALAIAGLVTVARRRR
jgi:hypothetical protein